MMETFLRIMISTPHSMPNQTEAIKVRMKLEPANDLLEVKELLSLEVIKMSLGSPRVRALLQV